MANWSQHILVDDLEYEQAEALIRQGEARWIPNWPPLVWACWAEVGWADPRDRIQPPGIEVYWVYTSSVRSLGLDVQDRELYFIFICPALQWAVLARSSGDRENSA